MAKRNQILRVPQKKYTEDMLEDLATIKLPHEQLIPAKHSGNTLFHVKSANTSNTSHSGVTSVSSITNTSADASLNTSELHSVNQASKNDEASNIQARGNAGRRGGNGNIGVTSNTSISGESNSRIEMGVELKGRARDVWSYFCAVINQQEDNNRVRVSRRQIQKESGIGSLNTVDAAIAMLQGRGWLLVHPLPGSNGGYEYEVLLEHSRKEQSQTPKAVAELLRRAAHMLEEKSESLSVEQMNKWSKIAFQAKRLIEKSK